MSGQMRRNIRLMYAVRFFSSLHFIGGILIPFFTKWGRIEDPIIPLIQTWFILWAAILEVPTGVVADRFGRKMSLVIGLLITSIGFIVYVSKPHIAMFLLGEFIIALGIALVSGADEALLYDTLIELGKEGQATKIISQIGNMGMLGLLIGTPAGSLMAVHFGYPSAHIGTGITILVAALVALLLIEPQVYKTAAYDLRYKEVFSRGIGIFWNHRAVRWIGVDLAVVAAFAGTIIWHYQWTLEHIELPEEWFGTIAALGIVSEIVFNHAIPLLERKMGFTNLTRFSAYLPVVGFFLTIAGMHFQSWIITIFGIVLVFSTLIGRKGFMRAHANRYIPSSERATVISTIELVRKGFIGLAYLIMSIALTHSVVLSLVMMGTGILVFSLISPLQRKRVRMKED